MTSAQEPIGSGFGRESTPSDVLGDTDLSGTLAVVTGGYSGLGLETTRAFASVGADVVVPARRPDHAASVVAELGDLPGSVSVAPLDLGDQSSVTAFTASMRSDGRPIGILVNNAAIMACPETRIGPGWEAQFGTNHLGHYAMTGGLWPLLADGGARVVSLSSTGHKRSGMRWDDVMFERDYEKWTAYGQAKTANALFAVHLDAMGQEYGVRAFAVHPGGIMTELQRHLPQQEMIDRGWIDADGNVNELFKSPDQGAATSVWAATSSQLDGMGGVYCEDCDVAAQTDPESPFAAFIGVDTHATDPAEAERLWTLSAELTAVNPF